MSKPASDDNPAAKSRSRNSVHFTQRDVAQAVAFYRDKLGFDLDECWPDPKQPMWASMSRDSQVVMLGAAMDPAMMKEHGADPEVMAVWEAQADDWSKHKPGVGVQTYLWVDDVDAFHTALSGSGVTPLTKPISQFYGIRDFMVEDPSGHRLVFYSPIQMTSCQSCGMPLQDAVEGQMYCAYCVDDSGHLKAYEQVLEGTIRGYFMEMQKMPRAEAEVAAEEHLKTMPAWIARAGQ